MLLLSAILNLFIKRININIYYILLLYIYLEHFFLDMFIKFLV